jgi:tRNA-specific 2-thiouridylase
MSKKVFVGMSGGVDSSVTAALLQQQGYEVSGVYMKNWSKDLPGLKCPWQQDYEDAKRVAVGLGIPFSVYDFEDQYRRQVVDYMINEYKAGHTPNPDIMCNQEIKFGLFLKTALSQGADMIATGHYAKVKDGHLLVAKNKQKDQTYFLCRVKSGALAKSLMPIGEFETKEEVRQLARKFGLATAEKKDSQGICFIGEVGIKEFLLNELGPQPSGNIIDQNGKIIGTHDGAIFYTIGQRHGLQVGIGLPYYITSKDIEKNEVYVSTDLQDTNLWQKQLKLNDTHWINEPPKADRTYQIRTRYRADLINGSINISGKTAVVDLDEEVRAATAGQSAVVYDGEVVVGGGIIS